MTIKLHLEVAGSNIISPEGFEGFCLKLLNSVDNDRGGLTEALEDALQQRVIRVVAVCERPPDVIGRNGSHAW